VPIWPHESPPKVTDLQLERVDALMLNQNERKTAPVEPPARLSALVTPIWTRVRSRATCVATRRSRGVEPAAGNHPGKASRQENRSPSEPGETEQAALKTRTRGIITTARIRIVETAREFTPDSRALLTALRIRVRT